MPTRSDSVSPTTETADQVFDRYGRYYDLLYRDKDYAGEADYVVRKLRSVCPQLSTVLEFGSGTGRHGRLLAERGLQVTGIERSQSMVTAARPVVAAEREVGSFRCQQGDVRTADVGCQFDAVISLFHVVSYQTTNADLLLTLANAARHLKAGGVFFFDVWHGPAVLNERPAVRVKRIEDEETLLWRLAEPVLDTNAGVVTVRYTMLAASREDQRLTMFQEEHRMRYLFASEVEMLAAQAGFSVQWSEEFLTGAKPSEATWGVAYLLRKAS